MKVKHLFILFAIFALGCNLVSQTSMVATIPTATAGQTGQSASYVLPCKNYGALCVYGSSASSLGTNQTVLFVETIVVAQAASATAVPSATTVPTSTLVPSATLTAVPSATFTVTPSFTPTNTVTPSATPTNTITPSPTNTPTITPSPTNTATFTPSPTATYSYGIGKGNNRSGELPEGIYFVAPGPQCYRPGVAIWIRVAPQPTEWSLTVHMHNVTKAQGWAGYKESFVGKMTTQLSGQEAVVTVPAGVKEFLLWFTNGENCDYMGVQGNVVPGNSSTMPATPAPQPPPTALPVVPTEESVPDVKSNV